MFLFSFDDPGPHLLLTFIEIITFTAASSTSREILDKLLKLRTFISEKCPQCQTIYSTPTIPSDKAKAKLKARQCTNLLQLKIDAVDNRNIVVLIERDFI